MCYDVDIYQTIRGYNVLDAGMCQVLVHPKWGTHIYTTIVFCNGELDKITKFILASFS